MPAVFRLTLAALLLATSLHSHGFDLQAHRGARGLTPENTLPSFAQALGIGVTTLELDIAITKDGVLVITHDRALNPDITRGADGRFIDAPGPLVSSLSFAELGAYDVGRIKPGTAYARQFSDQKALDGTRIPRLADLFALVKKSGNDKVRFAIETKLSPLAPQDTLAPEAFARAVIAAIREAGMVSRTSVLSFDWRTLQVIQRDAPEIPTVYLSIQRGAGENIGADKTEPSPWTAGIRYVDHGSVPRMIKAAGGHTWSAFHMDLTSEKVKEAKTLGLQVLAWTVNEPARMAAVLDMGVDGIVTDRPDLLREEMKRRGMPLPNSTTVSP
ncbi:MAG TPA: glycerophosphodiester phosphodiesterase [Polaromonas sp.]|uniref:glycerophosphodiester phosphodiesterase n=1 Tax=Polaromonas sp. TaxID=1869339 RepID=UPI002D4A5061|nr:glycerophosphodiester phosphodiesterase [Polaromonas sp.]HYW55433.1 glycerophosphodiester phosphodiesterase [Polaromonas sp.]